MEHSGTEGPNVRFPTLVFEVVSLFISWLENTHTHTLPLATSVMTKEGKHQHPEILCVLRLDQYGLLKANTDYFSLETKIVIVF